MGSRGARLVSILKYAHLCRDSQTTTKLMHLIGDKSISTKDAEYVTSIVCAFRYAEGSSFRINISLWQTHICHCLLMEIKAVFLPHSSSVPGFGVQITLCVEFHITFLISHEVFFRFSSFLPPPKILLEGGLATLNDS